MKRILMTILVFFFFLSGTAWAEGDKGDEEIDELKEQVEESNGKKEALQKELEGVQHTIHGTEEALAAIQAKLQETEQTIAKLTGELEKKTNEIKRKQNDITITQAKLESKRKAVGDSIAYRDQLGDLGFLEFVIQSFNAKNLSEILAAREFLTTIREENQQLFKQFKEQEAVLRKQKATLDKQKKDLAEKKKEVDHYKAVQTSQLEEQDQILSRLKGKEEELLHHIKEEEAAQAALNESIQSIIKKREEEKAAQGVKPPLPSQGGGLANPMAPGSYTFTSGFGYRTHPVFGDRRLHTGVDFAAPVGTPIYSSGSGYVLFSGPAKGYGNWIVIEHDNGYYTIYGHMYDNGMHVSPGERVEKGQHIADVGNAGTSTGAHLHMCVATGYNITTGSFDYIDPMTVLQ